jgi:hypothetical protein
MSPERQRARRRAVLWFLAALALIAVSLFVLHRSRDAQAPARPLVDPLSLVPPGPAFVLTVDVARLRTTDLGKKLIGSQLARLANRKTRAPWDDCQPMLSGELDRLVIAVPGADLDPNARVSEPTVGVIASGRFRKDPALLCVQGSSGFVNTVRTTIGSFDTLRDRRTTREVAARDGLLVHGDGTYFRTLLDCAEQHCPPSAPLQTTRDQLHSELRRLFGRDAPIVVTLVLPQGWLPAVLADPSAAASPLADIRAAALRLEVTAALTFAGTLRCDRDDSCTRLEHFLTTLRTDLATLDPTLAAFFTKLTLTRQGPALDFSGTLTLADLDQLSALLSPPTPPTGASGASASPSASAASPSPSAPSPSASQSAPHTPPRPAPSAGSR